MKRQEIGKLDQYLKKLFQNNNIAVRARPKMTDSAEVYIEDEFIGTLYRIEEEDEISWSFQMAILDIDLEQD